MRSNNVLEVKAVSKSYALYNSPFSQLAALLSGGVIGKHDTQYVLESLSFSVEKGTTLGIVGRNGVGKSTLLQVISGIVKPTSGEVQIRGKIAALLELGAGFNPEYTGVENIYLVCAIYGMTKNQTAAKLEEIIEFASIGEYVYRPVKTYSSGMFVRLAFAIIASLDVEILIVDEALAVGDIQFQQKCNRFFKHFKESGGTVIFVSHDVTLVKSICEKALYLYRHESSPKYKFGKSEEVCNKYLSDYYEEEEQRRLSDFADEHALTRQSRSFIKSQEPPVQITFGGFNPACSIEGPGGLIVQNVFTLDLDGHERKQFKSEDVIGLRVSVVLQKPVRDLSLAIVVKDRTGQYLISDGTSELVQDGPVSLSSGQAVIFDFSFKLPYLIEGAYSVDLNFTDGTKLDHSLICIIRDSITITVSKGRNVVGLIGFNEYNFHVSVTK